MGLFAPKEPFTVKKQVYFPRSDPVEYTLEETFLQNLFWKRPALQEMNSFALRTDVSTI